MTWFGLFRKEHFQILSIEFQEMNYPLTERQDPSDFHAVRPSRRNARQQPESQKAHHEALEQGSNLEHQASSSRAAGTAYASQFPGPPMDKCSSPDLETTALLNAVKSGDIGLYGMEGKEYFDEGTGVVKEVERSGWSVDVENSSQPFEQLDIDSLIAAPKGLSRLQDYTDDGQGENCFGTPSSSGSGRPKFVIPKVPEISKLLERCT